MRAVLVRIVYCKVASVRPGQGAHAFLELPVFLAVLNFSGHHLFAILICLGPLWSQKAPKASQRAPKARPKGAKGHQKGANWSLKEPNGDQIQHKIRRPSVGNWDQHFNFPGFELFTKSIVS